MRRPLRPTWCQKNSTRLFKIDENSNAYVTKGEKEAKVVREGNKVHVYATLYTQSLCT